jgi:hypothetical protein
MRTSLMALLLAGLAMPVLSEPLDLHDPAALVARARAALRDDDFNTACVLLSRAGQLAPHDARIGLAWGDYEARQQGLPIAEEASKPVTPALSPPQSASRGGAQFFAKPVAPEPPAPWPAK